MARDPLTNRRRLRSTWRFQLQVEPLEDRCVPAGTITGVVFQDFNANGVRDLTTTIANHGNGAIGVAVDRGLAGISVTAFDAGGAIRGNAVSAANGAYTLNATGSGPYRIQFGAVPAGFFPGPRGLDSGPTVQFVADGNSSNINIGLVRPADYAANNPELATNSTIFGPANGPYADFPAVISFPYSAGSQYLSGSGYTDPSSHALAVRFDNVGATGALAFSRATQLLYASAFMKKHSGFGPSGTGAIYVMGTTGASATLFADLNVIFGPGTAGTDPHDNTDENGNGFLDDYDTDNGNAAWDAVGKISLGGMDLSPDATRLYVVNLADRQLYALGVNAAGGFDGTAYRVPIPGVAGVPGATGAGAHGDLRPYAVQVYDGVLYVGMVNSAESTGSAADLRAYVYAVTDSGAALTFAAAPILNLALNYPRGFAQTFDPFPGLPPAEWLAWKPTFQTLEPASEARALYPQPWLTGLTFDLQGNLVLGLRDRIGDQTGYFSLDHPGDAVRYQGMSTGDTLRAFINVAGDPASGYVLESNGRGPAGQGTGPQNNGQGPGNAEFYFLDNFPGAHDEVSLGGVLQVPGFPDVVTTVFNAGQTVRTGGLRWFNNTTGGTPKGYDIYITGFVPPTPPPPTFGKANGLGDLVPLTTDPPIQVGDRVFQDSNGNGIQDAGEPGIAGVTVSLYSPTNALLAAVLTDADGSFTFSSGPGTSSASFIFEIAGLTPNTAGFSLRLDNPADYTGSGPLAGRSLTTANAGSDDRIDSDAVNVAGFPRIAFGTGVAGANDHTLDAGFRVEADLSLTKTVDTPNPNLGENVVFTIMLANAGPSAASQVAVKDLLPAGLSFVSASPSQGSYDNGGGVWTVGNVASGDSATLSITATVTTTGTKINTAQVSASDQFDPDSTPDNDNPNEDDQSSVTLNPQAADLSLTKTVDTPNPNLGANVVFTIMLANAGPSAASQVAVKDLLPAGLSFVSASPSQGSYDNGSGVWTVGNIASGDTATLSITATVTTTGTKINTAQVSASDQFDPDSTPDNDNPNEDDQSSAPLTPVPVGDVGNLSGFVYWDRDNDGVRDLGEFGIQGVKVRLKGVDDLGQVVAMTILTGPDGAYSFTDLRPGAYQLIEKQPAPFVDGKDTLGSLGGIKGNDKFKNILLAGGSSGTAYNFGERGLTVEYINKGFVLNSEVDMAALNAFFRERRLSCRLGLPRKL